MSLPREIHDHEVEGESVRVRVLAMDVPLDGASHEYRFERDDGAQVGNITFHRGRIEENICDVNGATPEAVLGVLIDHFTGLQSGETANKQFMFTLKRLKEALEALQVRTKERIESGAENLAEV